MDELAAFERRFRRAGLPLFIEDYTATEDVFTRAAPFLALVFIAELFGAINLDWSLWANVGAAAAGLAILVGAFGLVNAMRGRRFWAVPERVGAVELAVFVLVPAVLPLIFGGQVTSAIVTLGANALIVGIFWLGFGFAVLSIVRWAATRVFRELAVSLSSLSRAVPLLLLFAIVLFVNTEMWQVFATIPAAFLALVTALLVLLGAAFLVARLPREVRLLEQEAGGGGPPLNRAQRVNVGLVMFVSQALQVLVVSAAVGGFFVAFGALAIGPEVRESWIGSDGDSVLGFQLFGERVDVTEELLRVAGGIAAVSGLYYAIAVLTDSTYREEFLDDLTGDMRATFQARAEYLRLRA